MTTKPKLLPSEIAQIQFAKTLIGKKYISPFKAYLMEKDGVKFSDIYICDCLSPTPRYYNVIIITRFLEFAATYSTNLENSFKGIKAIQDETQKRQRHYAKRTRSAKPAIARKLV